MISWRGGLFYAGSAATTSATPTTPGTGPMATTSVSQSFVISDVDIDTSSAVNDGRSLFNVTLESKHRKGRIKLGNVKPTTANANDGSGSDDHRDRTIGIVQSNDGLKREIGRILFGRVEGMGDCGLVDANVPTLSNGEISLNTTSLSDAACVVSFSGTLDDVNAALRQVTYVPNSDETGEDSIVLSVNDTGYTGHSGVALVTTAQLDLWIDAVNDPPTITAPLAMSVTVDGVQSGTDQDDLDAFDGTQIFDIQVGDADMYDATMVATLSLDLLPPEGVSISLSSLVGLTFTRGGGVGHSALTAVGTLEHLNRALYGMSFLCDSLCQRNVESSS